MPTLSVQFQAQVPGSVILANEGPKIPVELRVPKQLEEYLVSQQQEASAPVRGLGLIDTGATFSMMDADAVSHLCVSPVGTVMLSTAGGPTESPLYPVRLAVVVPTKAGDTPLMMAELARITVGPRKTQGLLCLIGRDILQHAVLVYDGVGGHISLSF